MVVGIFRGTESRASFCLDELQHLRAGIEKKIDALLVEIIAGLALQIGDHRGAIIRLAGLDGVMIAGNPDLAAGDRRLAAEILVLLDQQNIEPRLAGCDRGGQSGCAGAHHEHVAGHGLALVLISHHNSP